MKASNQAIQEAAAQREKAIELLRKEAVEKADEALKKQKLAETQTGEAKA